MRRILILTPWAPYPATGACQQDRLWGMKYMREIGYDVRVIGRYHSFQDKRELEEVFKKEGINITLAAHRTDAWKLLLQKPWLPLCNLGWLDGAALEYADPEYVQTVRRTLEEWQPDLGWLEYCSHWPMAKLLNSYGIPVIMKSSNNEAAQCMDDHGKSLLSRIKAVPKYVSEWMVATESDLVLAVSPDEERWYKRLGAKKTDTLALRGLSQCLTPRVHQEKEVLDVVFLTSNYSMGHNRVIAEFVLREIIPRVQKVLPNRYRFHLTGKKFPEAFQKYLNKDVISTGFIPDIGAFLSTMDIALSPWITGQGMQQKVFEPLCRSLPTLTTKTGGYPFVDQEEILICQNAEDYTEGLQRLLSASERNRLSSNAFKKASALFSKEAVQAVMKNAIEGLI